MKILIKNANLISMSEERKEYEEQIDILINENKIEKIEKGISKEGVDKIVDATGKIIMPGFINTHAHIPMSIFRETLDGYTLQSWLTDKIWPIEDKMTPQEVYDASKISYEEMIQTGTTTVNDMYFFTDEIIKAALDSGVRLETGRTLMSINNDVEDRIEESKYLMEKYKNNPMITFNAGIHGLYTTDPEATEKFIQLAKEYDIKIHMHFCENTQEVEDIKKMHNVESPVDVIEKSMSEIPTLLAHAVKLTNEEIERISKMKNISISHCPISNLRLGCGIANIVEMQKKGINVSLGTDGQGSGSNLDMFETMKFTALLQKGINEEPKYLPAYEVLKMATVNGAKAMGMGDRIGKIEEGKHADIIMINTESIKMKPINNIFSNLVYNANGTNVEMTMINGKIVYEK